MANSRDLVLFDGVFETEGKGNEQVRRCTCVLLVVCVVHQQIRL
jgi:hypothetical protein